MVECIRQILQTQGVKGLYKGYTIHVLLEGVGRGCVSCVCVCVCRELCVFVVSCVCVCVFVVRKRCEHAVCWLASIVCGMWVSTEA